MFPIDPLWVYIAVPAVLVFILILIKLGQKEMDRVLIRQLLGEEREEGRTREEATEESLTEVKEAPPSETQEKTKPQGCLNYLGYLYMRKVPDRTHIPTECYNCSLLLRCLYSPVVVEKSTENENQVKKTKRSYYPIPIHLNIKYYPLSRKSLAP